MAFRNHRRQLVAGIALIGAVAALGPGASLSAADGPPIIGDAWSSTVFASSARLHVEIDPNGNPTTYHVDYITKAAYDANVAASEEPFTGTPRIPAGSEASIGDSEKVTTLQHPFSLIPDTVYRYRVIASNSKGEEESSTYTFMTRPLGSGDSLPDGRVWEMVSPVDKNGGRIDPPETLAGGGVLQAASAGSAVTYGSSASFGSVAVGAGPASQYISSRDANGNWTTQNITAPLFSGSYGLGDEGVPYRLFSRDLARGILLSGRHCRGENTDCAVANPPLPGTDAPTGYQNYYLRETVSSAFAALLGSADIGNLTLDPADFELSFGGASADLRHGVLSTCAALTVDATEVASGSGCDITKPNIYKYSPAGGLTLVNVLPSDSQGTPGAALGAATGAVSDDGSRVYWTSATGSLYVFEGGQSEFVDSASTFETAASDGSVAYYTKGGHLYRYNAAGGSSEDLTPTGGALGVFGASADGADVYYLTIGGLFHHHGATKSTVADAADAGNYPPSTGTARVTADGTRLLFVATASLTGRDNKSLKGGLPVTQVYLYDTSTGLQCISCNPTFARPAGASTIPGAVKNGQGSEATRAYKPRVLSADGNRAYFESADAIANTDTNGALDVYQWEAQGTGSCQRSGGCVSVISGGRSAEGSSFVDASSDGSDAFFLTSQALVSNDLAGSLDIYDARVNGKAAERSTEIVCIGDACQPPPEEVFDPPLGTQRKGPGNPEVNFQARKCRKGLVKHRGKCVTKRSKQRQQQQSKRHQNGRGR